MPFSDFLAALFQSLAREGVRPCVLRNYEGFPGINLGNDIDLLISPSQLPRAMRAMQSLVGIRIVGYTERRCVANVFLEGISRNTNTSALEVDFDMSLSWKGLPPFLSTEAILEAAIPRVAGNEIFFVPSPVHEAIISLLMSLFFGGWLKEKYLPQAQRTFAGNRSAVIAALSPRFGQKAATQLVDAVIEGDRNKILRCVWPLRRSLLLRSLMQRPFSSAFDIAHHYASEFAFRYSPRALESVFILAPHDSERAVLAEALIPRLQSLAMTVEQHPLLPRPVLRSNPSAKAASLGSSAAVLSVAGLASWVAKEWLNQFAGKKNLALRICQGCCPLPAGLLSGWIMRRALRLLPSPVLCILLDPGAEELAAASQEHISGNANQVCRALVEKGKSYMILDANQPDERITGQAYAAIVNALTRQAEQRLNKRFPQAHSLDAGKAAL